MCDGACARAHEEEARRGRFSKKGEKGFGDADGADDVNGGDFAHGFAGNGVHAEDAGVVDEGVETAVCFFDVGGGGVDGGVGGYVYFDGGDGAFEGEGLEGGDGGGAGCGVAAAEEDVVFGGGEEEVFGGFEADALVGAWEGGLEFA